MSDSVWKKEISFKRKPKDEAPEAPVAAPKQSIWKKEIGFKRTPEAEPVETPESLRLKELAFQQKLAEAAQAPAPVPVPVQMQEAAPAPVVEVALPAPPPPPAPVAEAPHAAPAEPESIWKKEISFRRKPSDEAPAGEAPVDPTPDAFSAQPVSIWKKEISFRRKPGAEGGGESIWTKDISLRRKQARSAQVRLLAEEALRAIEETSPEPDPDEPWLAGPELPPEPLAEVAPAAVPVPTPPAPAVDEPEPKVPFWKREIGKSKAKEPKAEKQPKEPKAEKEPKAKRERKPRTRLRDVKVSLPKPSPKAAHAGGNHQVKRLVGLKVGASQLAAARVVNNGAAELVQVARQPLEQGVVVGGEVRDPEALALALKQFFARNKLPRKNVRIGIGTNRVGVRVLDVTGVEDEDQLANAVTFRAHETMAIPMDQAVLDYHVVGRPETENGTAYRVVLAAAYREPIDQLVMACQAAHLELMGIDVEAFALLRAVGSRHTMFEQEEGPTAVVAVALGHDRSILAISDGNVCDFTRVLDWGGAKLDAAITRGAGVTSEEAAELKLNLSLDPDDDPGDASMARAREAVRGELSNLARELIASLQFYQSQPESLAIGEILVTGGTSKMPGLVDELAELVRANVTEADPLAAVEVPDSLNADDRDDLPSLAVAIGLGVEV